MATIFKIFINLILLVNILRSDEYNYDSDYYELPKARNYVTNNKKVEPRFIGIFKTKKVKTNQEIFADLLDPSLSVQEVTARLPTKEYKVKKEGINARSAQYCNTNGCNTCLESCHWLSKSKYTRQDIAQYTYLRLCSEGCKENLACLQENYCLPVMEENPDYFVLCANKCPLFAIVPNIFKTSECNKT